MKKSRNLPHPVRYLLFLALVCVSIQTTASAVERNGHHSKSQLEVVWVKQFVPQEASHWPKTIPFSGERSGSPYVEPTAVLQSYHNVIVALTLSIEDQTVGVYVINVSEDGELIWQQRYGGGKRQRIEAIRQSTNGYFLVGTLESAPGKRPYPDLWILRVDHDGRVLWEKTFQGGPEVVYPEVVVVENDQLRLIGPRIDQGDRYRWHDQKLQMQISEKGILKESAKPFLHMTSSNQGPLSAPRLHALVNGDYAVFEKIPTGAIIALYDRNGDLKWQVPYKSEAPVEFVEMIPDDNNYLVVGTLNPYHYVATDKPASFVALLLNRQGRIESNTVIPINKPGYVCCAIRSNKKIDFVFDSFYTQQELADSSEEKLYYAPQFSYLMRLGAEGGVASQAPLLKSKYGEPKRIVGDEKALYVISGSAPPSGAIMRITKLVE